MSALSGIYFHASGSALLPLILHIVLSTLVKLGICGFLGSVGISIWALDAVTLKEISAFVLKMISADKYDL